MRKVKAVGDPDLPLVERSKTGDPAAFEELLSRHFAQTHALIFRLTDANRVDDLTQVAFLLAYKNIRRFRGEAKFSTWLTRIAVNLCRAEWRKRKKLGQNRTDDFWRKADAWPDVKEKTPSQDIIAAETEQKIDREIEALPPKLRIVFTLRYIEGRSAAEVAAILGCREGTVRSRLFNARQILKVRLKELVE